jgi:C-terminal processing protease CtpA/Prc
MFIGICVLAVSARMQESVFDAEWGHARAVVTRSILASNGTRASRPGPALVSAEARRQAVDTYWGPGLATEVKLQIFDKFWQYVDDKFVAFQGIDVDWAAVRERYRAEVAVGVSRGRFAAIMNQLSLALTDTHSSALDDVVNYYTLPERGTPLLAVGAWTFDTIGACVTAQEDGSALVYSALAGHPLGLERGDRILGYDGRPWRELYRELLREELPLWPLWWGSSATSFDHSFVMAAGTNWHLFETMDIAKRTGQIVHVSTSLMPGIMWYGFCSEQMRIPGVPKPAGVYTQPVSRGIIEGSRIGYIYVWSWATPTVEAEFADAVDYLTRIEQVQGLIIDFRFNAGGFLRASLRGIGALVPHPEPTIGLVERMRPGDHFQMQVLAPPSEFRLDFDLANTRFTSQYGGPIAVLVGPGAASAGDFSSLWTMFHPNARSFGRSTATTFNLPTQPALGTELNLHPGWTAGIAEANSYKVDEPHAYLTHREFPVDELVWLRPEDVAQGRDTVVEAAVRWIRQQTSSQ